jgi:hypothetical protein
MYSIIKCILLDNIYMHIYTCAHTHTHIYILVGNAYFQLKKNEHTYDIMITTRRSMVSRTMVFRPNGIFPPYK